MSVETPQIPLPDDNAEAQKILDYLNDQETRVTDLTRMLLLIIRKYAGDNEKIVLEKVAAATLGAGDTLNLDVTAEHYVLWTTRVEPVPSFDELWDDMGEDD